MYKEFGEWQERELILQAQKGNSEAVDVLMNHLFTEKAGLVWRMAKQSTQYDRAFDDFRQEFMVGAWKALDSADPDRSPIGFMVQKGLWGAMDFLRSGYRKSLVQHCNACKQTTAVLTKFGKPECPRCGNNKHGSIDRMEMYTPVDYGDPEAGYSNLKGEEIDVEEIANQELIERFRQSLKGKVREVYDHIMVEGIDRDSSRNYIKDIAAIMGVSTTNVNLRLRTIKQKWVEFQAEQERFNAEFDAIEQEFEEAKEMLRIG